MSEKLFTVHVWHIGQDDEDVQALPGKLRQVTHRLEDDVLTFVCRRDQIVYNLRILRFSDAVTDGITIKRGNLIESGETIAEDWQDIRLRWPTVDDQPEDSDIVALDRMDRDSAEAVRGIAEKLSHQGKLIQFLQDTLQEVLHRSKPLQDEKDTYPEQALDSIYNFVRRRLKTADRTRK